MIHNLYDLVVIRYFLYHQYLEGLKLFLHLFVLGLCVFDVLVCYFCIDISNRDIGYYSYVVTGNNFCIDYCNLSFDFVNYFVICFDNYHLICDNLICYMNYSLIFCLNNSDFDCLNNFYLYYVNSFYICCMMSFVIYHWNSVYSLGLNGNLIQKQILLYWNSIVNSYFGFFGYSIGLSI